MKYAILSDVHANLPAWNAVLQDLSSLDIDYIINLGDIVGYGPSPSEVLTSVREHASASVIGNHDAVCANRLDPKIFNDNARAVIEWTKDQLDEDATRFLEEMHEMIRPEGARFLVTHAEVASPLDFGYILTPEDAAKNFAACEDSIIFIGHTHFAGVFMEDESGAVTAHQPEGFQCDPNRRYIINPGSIGDPRTTDIVASYCIYDSDNASVEFRAVAFDIELYRELHASSGLTSKPYFLRYLDDISSGGKQMTFPSVGDSEIRPTIILSSNNSPKTPNINLSGSLAAGKTTKKKSPLYILVILFLLIGGGLIAWMTSNKTDNTAESTQKNTSSDSNKAPKKEPEITLDQTIAKPIEPIEPEIPEVAIKFPVTGRYVRISNAKGPYLTLAEVEVHNQLGVISKGKKATQSSDYSPSMNASRAIDGNHKGDNPDIIAHTKDDNSWWEVDLGKDLSIHQVNIWNREGHKYMGRLNGFTLQVFNEKRQIVYQTDDNPGATHIIEIK